MLSWRVRKGCGCSQSLSHLLSNHWNRWTVFSKWHNDKVIWQNANIISCWLLRLHKWSLVTEHRGSVFCNKQQYEITSFSIATQTKITDFLSSLCALHQSCYRDRPFFLSLIFKIFQVFWAHIFKISLCTHNCCSFFGSGLSWNLRVLQETPWHQELGIYSICCVTLILQSRKPNTYWVF